MSKSEEVLTALLAQLETVTGAELLRNQDVPVNIPSGGLIILRDGDPGNPDVPLGDFGSYYYAHAVEIELYVQSTDTAARDALFDDLLSQIGTALFADPTLGGTVFGMSLQRPATQLTPIEGGAAIKSALIEPVIDYETATPLG